MADIGGLQLLPETRKKLEIKVPGVNRPLYFAFTLLIIIIVIFALLIFYTNSLNNRIVSLDQEINSIESKRDKEAEKRILTVHSQLNNVNQVVNSHLFWSKGFGRIESLVIPQIRFDTISANFNERKFDFIALAPNYTTVARQIAAFFTDDALIDVSLNKITVLPTGFLNFNMRLNFDPEKFLKQK